MKKKKLYCLKKFENRSYYFLGDSLDHWVICRIQTFTWKRLEEKFYLGTERGTWVVKILTYSLKSESVSGISWCLIGMCCMMTCILQLDPVMLWEWNTIQDDDLLFGRWRRGVTSAGFSPTMVIAWQRVKDRMYFVCCFFIRFGDT